MATGETQYRLRPARADDFPAIRRLIHSVRINPVGLRWPNFVVAIYSSGQIIGCGQIKKHGDGSHELASIAVVPEWRSRGIARAIICRLLTEHPGRLFLTCRNELGPFYQRFGFRVAEEKELSPYFQRLKGLVRWLQFFHLAPGKGLLVMVHD